MNNAGATEEWENGLTETTVEINCPDGKVSVPGLIQKDCPGLAVTMAPFGVFTVTHVSTGHKLCNGSQRMACALWTMSQFALVASMKGTSWADLDQGAAVNLIKEAALLDVPFDGYTNTSSQGTRKMTVGEWFQAVRMPVFDEFPWEEKDPFDEAVQNFEKIEDRS